MAAFASKLLAGAVFCFNGSLMRRVLAFNANIDQVINIGKGGRMHLKFKAATAILTICLLTACSLKPCCDKGCGTSLEPGESRTVTIHADRLWNNTSIHIEKEAEYTFAVSNRAAWYDASIRSAANGYSKVWLAPFVPFRRTVGLPWFALVCTVDFKDDFRVFDDSECFGTSSQRCCCDRAEETCRQTHSNFRMPGTLYCYANDASFMYGNNSGSVEMTVTKTKNERTLP